MPKRQPPPDDRECHSPLPDGSRCHLCRIYDGLDAAERVLEPDETGLLVMRCASAVAHALANLLMEIPDATAQRLLERIYADNRLMRVEHGIEDDDEHQEVVGHA